VTVYLPGGGRPPREGLVRVPPDVVVEVISSRRADVRRDRVDKSADYAAFGVRWYWLVDPKARTVEILERTADGGYVEKVRVSGDVVRDVPGCTGLVLDVPEMWRELDRLEPVSRRSRER
jgi:Uma2 family endonuclease